MNPWDQFTGANAGYVYELFERQPAPPSSVDEATRRAFANWTLRTRHQRRLKPSLSNRLEATCKRALPHSISPSRFAASVTCRRARPARLSRSDWRSVAAAAGARPDRRDTGSACRSIGRDPRHRAPRMPSRRSPGCARSTAPPPATITTRCSSRTSGVAAPRGGVAPVPAAQRSDRRPRAARSHHRSRDVRAFPAPHFLGKTRFSIEGLDMMVPVLDEISLTTPPRAACST